MTNPRIFLGVVEIAGYLQNLFLGFRKLGYDAGYLNVNAFSFNYNAYVDENYRLLNFFIRVAKKASTTRGIRRIAFKALYWLVKVPMFFWCLLRFDVFIFCAGSSFFWFADYRILKLFKKKIIYVSLGSDSRPAYMNGSYKDDTEEGIFNPAAVHAASRETCARIRRIEKYADVLINYPQHAHFHSRSFISGNFIGFPTRLTAESVSSSNAGNGTVRILHAPTRPKAKGSPVFRQLIKELQDEGLAIDFVEITGKTNQEVLQEIKMSDIVLDELYSDLPLGGLGSEAACLGKPVVLGGYYSEFVKSELTAEYLPPALYCRPDEIKETLRTLVLNDQIRKQSAADLNAFLNENWAVDCIARKYLRLIDGSYPADWEYNPNDLKYFFGWGLSREEFLQNIVQLVEIYGFDSLYLSHNPDALGYLKALIQDKEYV